jgi:hypothetical protein
MELLQQPLIRRIKMSEATLAAGEIEVEVRSPKTDRSVSFVRNFGETLEQAAEMFGAEVVHSVFVAQAVIRAQGAARSVLDNAEKGGEDAVSAGQAYTPGVVRRSGKKKEDAFDTLAKKVQSGELTQEMLMAELQKRMTVASAE